MEQANHDTITYRAPSRPNGSCADAELLAAAAPAASPAVARACRNAHACQDAEEAFYERAGGQWTEPELGALYDRRVAAVAAVAELTPRTTADAKEMARLVCRLSADPEGRFNHDLLTDAEGVIAGRVLGFLAAA